MFIKTVIRQGEKITELEQENKELYEENKELRNENEELKLQSFCRIKTAIHQNYFKKLKEKVLQKNQKQKKEM